MSFKAVRIIKIVLGILILVFAYTLYQSPTNRQIAIYPAIAGVLTILVNALRLYFGPNRQS